MNLLKKRGIDKIAKQHDWKPATNYGPGWAYPVYDYETGNVLAHRFKGKPGTKMKYGWIPGKPDHANADWYILPETPDAIKANNGVCYLANGEPSLLAYHAAGIHNAIATTLSEVGIPKNLIDVLQGFGISRLIYPVDNDSAGEKSAINWRDALRDSVIDYESLSWGEFAPKKADANDMWILAEFAPVIFRETLRNAIPLQLPAPEVTKLPQITSDFTRTPDGLISAIISQAESRGYRGHGEWVNGKCLFPENHTHGDRNPSAGINKTSGVFNCFTCGKSLSVKKVAEHFNINWKAYYPEPEARHNTNISTAKFSDAPGRVWFPDGMADSWRSEIMQCFTKTTGAIIEGANIASNKKLINPQCFEIPELIEALHEVGFYISKSSVYNQLEILEDTFFPKSDTNKDNNNTLSGFGNKSHRPAQCYSFRSLQDAYERICVRAKYRLWERMLPPDSKHSLLPVFNSDILQSIDIEDSQEAAESINNQSDVEQAHNREQEEYQKLEKRISKKLLQRKEAMQHLKSTPLADYEITNGRSYGDAFYRGIHEAEARAGIESNRSRQERAELIGVRPQQITSTDARNGIGNIDHKPIIKIESSQQAYAQKGYLRKAWIVDTATGEVETLHEPKRRIIAAAVEQGKQVKIEAQLPNIQFIAEEEPIAAKPVARIVNPKPETSQENPVNPIEIPEEKPIVPMAKQGEYYGDGYDPVYSAKWINRALFLANSRFRISVMKSFDSEGYSQYHAQLIDLDTGQVADRLLSGDVIRKALYWQAELKRKYS